MEDVAIFQEDQLTEDLDEIPASSVCSMIWMDKPYCC